VTDDPDFAAYIEQPLRRSNLVDHAHTSPAVIARPHYHGFLVYHGSPTAPFYQLPPNRYGDQGPFVDPCFGTRCRYDDDAVFISSASEPEGNP
jgi:hypothetical protein